MSGFISKPLIRWKGTRYAFLSNESYLKTTFNGRKFPSVEHAFLAARSMHPADHRIIANCRLIAKARLKARDITMVRPFWNKCRHGIMLGLLESKFSDQFLGRLLIKTHPRELIFRSNDTYWGINSKGEGDNNLGILLMIVRDNLRLNRGAPYLQKRLKLRAKVKRWRAKTSPLGQEPLKPMPKLPPRASHQGPR